MQDTHSKQIRLLVKVCINSYYIIHLFSDSQDQATSINIDSFIIREKRGYMHILVYLFSNRKLLQIKINPVFFNVNQNIEVFSYCII